MKTKTTLFLLPALIAVLNLIPAGRATAQSFTTLHSFTANPHYNNTGGLEHQFDRAGRHRRAEQRHQSHHRRAEVFSVKSVIKRINP